MANKGFTLLEILFGIAILAIAITIVTLSFSKINENIALDKSVDIAILVLDEARSSALAAKSGSQYGVNIESLQLNPLVGIRNISLSGGGTSVIFNKLTGATSQSGSFEIYLKETSTTYKTINISTTGIIQEK